MARVFSHSYPFVDKKVLVALLAAALLAAACKPKEDDSIHVERVPKERPPGAVGGTSLPPGHPAIATQTPGMEVLPGMAEFTAATPTPKWSAPAEWVPQALTVTRKGSWIFPPNTGADNQAEISVTVFQGNLGGLLANVRRWRGRVGMTTDVSDDVLNHDVTNFAIDGRQTSLVSLDGPSGQSLDGALVIMPDRVWSFVLFGSTPVVKAQRSNFRAFLDSVKWQD